MTAFLVYAVHQATELNFDIRMIYFYTDSMKKSTWPSLKLIQFKRHILRKGNQTLFAQAFNMILHFFLKLWIHHR